MTDPKTVTVQERLRRDDDLSSRIEAADLLDRCQAVLTDIAEIAGLATIAAFDGTYEQIRDKAREVLTQLNGGRNV